MNKDIPIGARVLLLPESQHSNQMHTPYNPLSTFGEFLGENTEERGWYRVKWSNGKVNQYQGDESGLLEVKSGVDAEAVIDIFVRFVWDNFQVSMSNGEIEYLKRKIEGMSCA